MDTDDDDGIEIPEWVVTFGDMMSLLLTFFIMLVSLSEVKQKEKFQAMVESFHQQFGYEASHASLTPGDLRPRNSRLANLATTGRAKRKDTMRGGAKVEAPVGENKRVVTVRPGQHAMVAALLVFDEKDHQLKVEHHASLEQIATMINGKPQIIEVRGHTSRRPLDDDSAYVDHWHLAYQRSREVMKYMVKELGISRRRIRVSVAGSNEPLHLGTDPERMKTNSRVEVFLLEEVMSDFSGTDAERDNRFLDNSEP